MKKQNVYTVKDATAKLMRYCTYQERCHKEVEQKLMKFHLTSEECQEVIVKLIADNFLNEERFAKAFAYDKFNLKKWGRNRITQELKFRKISDYLITKALQEIDEKIYLQNFEDLFEKRLKAIKETHPLKRKKKVADFLLRKGYEPELVYENLQKLD